MRFKFILCALLLTLTLSSVPAGQGESGSGPSLTIWLIPSEGPDESSPVVGSSVIEQIEVFNQKYGKGQQVTVLNTTVPLLLDQLVAWNPDYAVPTWPIIKGQRYTLDALSRFAAAHNVHINVRFVSWGRIFDDLQTAATSQPGERPETEYAPDVAQVGSTWIAYFAQNGFLLPQTNGVTGNLNWRALPGIPQASLKLTTDVRLLFYWKRRRGNSPTTKPFVINTESWQTLLQSIQEHMLETGSAPSQPMVMPIGLSQNLLHDLIPLTWFSGGSFLDVDRSRVDLTGPQSLAIPMLIARNTLLKDEKQQSHRCIAFPEIGHDEAARWFITGDYIATIEPAAFIKRWHDQFKQPSSPGAAREIAIPPAANFWDYANAAVPPVAFKGGSDLIVLRNTKTPELAFELMSFLARDEAYTKVLSELGFLPAQREDFGIADMMTTLVDQADTRASREIEAFAAVVRQALAKGREYPVYAAWPTELESRDVLESLQRLWRRIGEWNEANVSKGRIEAAAAEAELTINRRINWRVKWWEDWKRVLPLFGIGLIAVIGLVLGQRQRYRFRQEQELIKRKALEERAQAEAARAKASEAKALMEADRAKVLEEKAQAEAERAKLLEQIAHAEAERANALEERAKALDQVRQVRGFASSALHIVYETHHFVSNSNPYRRPDETDRKAAEKALVVAAGLQGWRRGRDDRNWEDTPLEQVAWRSIILALESTYIAQLFKQWEQDGMPAVPVFLKEKKLLREMREVTDELLPFYFEVNCPVDVLVATPFMLEQALVCLLQNAIKASRRDAGYTPIAVTYDRVSDIVSVINEGQSLNAELCRALSSSDLDEFERRVDALLHSRVGQKPGIGLVEAYSIATQCYGGFIVDPDQPRFSIRLHSTERKQNYENPRS
jgi:ABC-type glycerol-3-phosphate transport system substrate-binding protein